jgi:hypothetical protein
MKALSTSIALKNSKKLLTINSKNLHKTFRPTYYNLRLYYSNLRRNDHGYGRWDMVYGPEGHEKVLILK